MIGLTRNRKTSEREFLINSNHSRIHERDESRTYQCRETVAFDIKSSELQKRVQEAVDDKWYVEI